tara:strand:+ start:1103 stop:1345 length:243 start_codon:yes stop_codon:yes gene_type:complete
MRFFGFMNGFRGLAQDRAMKLESDMLSGILNDGGEGCNMAVHGEEIVEVQLEEVASVKKLVAENHLTVRSARLMGTCFGD